MIGGKKGNFSGSKVKEADESSIGATSGGDGERESNIVSLGAEYWTQARVAHRRRTRARGGASERTPAVALTAFIYRRD